MFPVMEIECLLYVLTDLTDVCYGMRTIAVAVLDNINYAVTMNDLDSVDRCLRAVNTFAVSVRRSASVSYRPNIVAVLPSNIEHLDLQSIVDHPNAYDAFRLVVAFGVPIRGPFRSHFDAVLAKMRRHSCNSVPSTFVSLRRRTGQSSVEIEPNHCWLDCATTIGANLLRIVVLCFHLQWPVAVVIYCCCFHWNPRRTYRFLDLFHRLHSLCTAFREMTCCQTVQSSPTAGAVSRMRAQMTFPLPPTFRRDSIRRIRVPGWTYTIRAQTATATLAIGTSRAWHRKRSPKRSF